MANRPRYYRLQGKLAVPVRSVREWARFMETEDRRVAEEMVGPVWVSTVFLALDHAWGGAGPPLLFETMTFPDKQELLEAGCWRCSSWDEAEAQHARVVEQTKAQLVLIDATFARLFEGTS